MTVIVAPICGPILGGYISDNYHWGWIFFINVPIGVAVVLMTLQTLRNRETKTEQRRIDGVGLALLIIGIGSRQVMLDRGKELDWFSSNEIIILTIVAVVAISFLIVWELTDDNPIVDLSLFKSRNFTIGCLCISLAYMLYFGAIVLLPQLLQEVYGYTATWAGLASAPVGVIPVILSPIIGRFAHKLDMRRLVTFSFIMYAVCFYWRAWTFEPGMDFGRLGVATVYPGLRGGLLLHAVDHHHPLRPAAGAAGGGVEPVELHPYPCRLHRDLDHHHPVDQPRGAASCAAHRIGDPL
ncbi:multidrug resistance protein B [Klebsiella pneumoniae]|nr:multidrug resistance protein B [Klebsiella pneumoniae]